MSKNTKARRDDVVDTIIGIAVVLAVIALFVFLFMRVSRANQALGQIAYGDELRRGSEQTVSCKVNPKTAHNGDKVTWTVNGRTVSTGAYEEGKPVTFDFTPQTAGNTQISVKVGKYRRSVYADVQPPKLTLTAPNVVVIYGDELPQMDYDCCGFVDGDGKDALNYDGECSVAQYTNCNSKLNAGVYKIEFSKPCQFKDYQVDYVCGTLTVLPKELTVGNDFAKVYDQTDVIDCAELNLCGVLENDDVTASCGKLYFDNKNVGDNKSVILSDVVLQGNDCKNYVLRKEAYGSITPRQITLDGLTVKNKFYDGTTRADVEQAGKLNGVLEGDSVAIGSVDVRFDEAFVGERSAVVEKVTLIGVDKDNYVLQDIQSLGAQILAR